MSTYTKATDFLAKDSLPLNNAAKYVKGSEIDTEFDAIETADADNMKKSAMGTGVETFLGTPSSANFAAAVTGETGTGALVFATSPTLVTPVLGAAAATSIAIGGATAISSQTGTGGVVVMATSPTLVTPVLGVATATSINKMAITAPASGSTLAIADGKTLTVSNTMTLTGTDGTSYNLNANGTTVESSINLFGVASETFGSGLIGANVKKVTLLFRGLSLTGGSAAYPQIQIGDAGGIETSGYTHNTLYFFNPTTSIAQSSGSLNQWNLVDVSTFVPSNADVLWGRAELTKMDFSGNIWHFSSTVFDSSGSFRHSVEGYKTVSGSAALTQIKILSSDGSNFDGSSYLGWMWE